MFPAAKTQKYARALSSADFQPFFCFVLHLGPGSNTLGLPEFLPYTLVPGTSYWATNSDVLNFLPCFLLTFLFWFVFCHRFGFPAHILGGFIYPRRHSGVLVAVGTGGA